MRIQSGQLVALGYGKYVRSDDVVAVEPITDRLDTAVVLGARFLVRF